MAKDRRSGSCCLKGCLAILITFILIIGLIVGAVYYVLNKTPDELGFADQQLLGEMSMRDLGLADTKLIDIVKAVYGFLKEPSESDIVSNPFNPSESAANLEAELGHLLPPDSQGDPDYSVLGDSFNTGADRYLVTLKDTDIAYLIDSMLEKVDEDGDVPPIHVREVTISKVGAKYKLRVVVKLDLLGLKDEINESINEQGLPPYVATQLSGMIPNAIYFISEGDLLVDSAGIATVENQELTVNGAQNILLDIIMQVINQENSNGEQEGEGEDMMDLLGSALSEGICQVINSIGEIGTADAGANNKVEDLTSIELGIVGLGANRVTVITRVEDTPPQE